MRARRVEAVAFFKTQADFLTSGLTRAKRKLFSSDALWFEELIECAADRSIIPS
jgi:hypothetical protein